MMLYSDTVILVFAKAPVSGEVNTRLIPDIGVSAATKLQEDFISQRLNMLQQANLCAVTLMCTPDVHDEYFVCCQRQYDITLLKQTGDDLGERMANGIKHALKNYQFCIVLGTDAPALGAKQIQAAIALLHADNNAVFVPAEDGGYVLVGLDTAYDFLFKGINWGSAEVMKQTREKLKQNDITFAELDTCWDIDRIEDYQRYLAMQKK